MASRFSFPLCRLAGIPVRASWLLPLVLVIYVVSIRGYTRGEVLLPVLIGFGVLLGSVFLHELGHAFAARREGLRVHGIRLMVLGGVTEHDPARTTGGELRVSLAGVAVNLALALAAGAASWAIEGAAPGRPALAFAGGWLSMVWGINLFLALFNLLPGIPFDGGHAAEALLALRYPRARARMSVLITGAVIGAGLLVLGLANEDVLLSVIGFSCLTAVGTGWRELQQGPVEDERLFGAYDFSRGYTSLEAPEPKVRARERERARRELDAREEAGARDAGSAKERLDRLLDRIAAQGISSLSPEERAFLNEESRRLRDRGRTPTRP